MAKYDNIIKCSGSAYQMIKELKEAGKDFEVRKTTRSTLLIFDDFKYMFADSHFKNHHLNLFQQMKNEVQKNINEKKLMPPEKSKSLYFKVKNFEPIGLGEFYKFENCLEFDINKAYYRALFVLGYIGEKFYKTCIELPKHVRLALVGTLATQKTIFYYENGELKNFVTKKNDILRRVFFQLVSFVDKILNMFSELAGDNFIFYWVDGIYLKNYPRAKQHKAILSKKFNIDFSLEPIKNAMIINKSESETKIILKKSNNKLKVFNLSSIFTPEQQKINAL